MKSAPALLAYLIFVLPADGQGFETSATRKYVDGTSIVHDFQTPSSYCAYADDYFNNRTQEFNLVSPHKVLKSLKSFFDSPQYKCVKPQQPRVLLDKQRLSSTFQTNLRVGDWCLSNGCVVQSFTVASQDIFPFECNSTVCKVSVDCIVPRIWIRYEYASCGKGDYTDGNVYWKFTSAPRTVRVSFKRPKKGNRECELGEIVSIDGLNEWWAINNEGKEYPEQKEIVNEFMKNPLLKNFFMEEAKLYAYQVIREAFYHPDKLFKPMKGLNRYCNQLIAPRGSVNPERDAPSNPPGNTLPAQGVNQTVSFSTNVKNDTEAINITVNININMPLPPPVAAP